MYAVLETGGKQYRVTEGDVLFLERLGGEPGDIVNFDKILACSNEIETDFGRPYLDDVNVEAKILGHGKNKKIVVYKYKAKKGYRKKQGHRQPYTKVRVERIISQKYGVASYTDDSEADNTDSLRIEADEIVDTDAGFAQDASSGADNADALDESGEEVIVEVDSDVIIADDVDTIVDVDSYELVEETDAEQEDESIEFAIDDDGEDADVKVADGADMDEEDADSADTDADEVDSEDAEDADDVKL